MKAKELNNALSFDGNEMQEKFGYNPFTSPDFDEYTFDEGQWFLANLEKKSFEIVDGFKSYGSFNMSQEDFEICLKIVGEMIAAEIFAETGEKVWADVNPATNPKTGTETDVRFSFGSMNPTLFVNELADEYTPIGDKINEIVMGVAGCNGALVTEDEESGLYFEFEDCIWS